ncbi:unnamed protein product [Pocillopora meandrina]|uniref:Uncharacterized protein n=1 Tax=Pocillopora meandrina TaxID=46732 RepID=A0AAU9X305_9CNID|nr:unnamed protein product [Pocillopora meandrina]
MAGRQASFFTALFFISLVFRGITSQRCHEIYSIYQMMLQGHTYKTFKTTPGTPECRDICLADDRCQSFNVVMFIAICELNNRTKEARPDDFVKDEYRYYMAKGPKRVPLGSIRELPAESCKEIKASEGEQAVNANYWLDSTRSGNSNLARCDMKTKVADYCVKHQCQNDAKCVNRETNYSCACNSSGWTGKYCEKDINECKEGLHGCHVNAICSNTRGSYNCTCKPGFIGDGQNSCKECGPVGVTDKNTIPDVKMTASSFYDSYQYPYYGRLNETRGKGGWCPKNKSDGTEYLQVDMDEVRSVCGVATQGVLRLTEWTTSYKLRLSTDGITWSTYRETNFEKVFTGNSDQTSIVKHSLRNDFKARYVRFYPVTFYAWPSLRVEIFELK